MLDFPCGHGRVLPALKAEFPDAELVAADVDPAAVDFCRDVFGVGGVHTSPDPRNNRIRDDFDLIWCGSLLTHMPAGKWPVFLEFFASHLVAGGVAVFTTHGRRIARYLEEMVADGTGPERRCPPYSLLRDEILRLLEDFTEIGFGYERYPNHDEYGFALSRPDWVARRVLEGPSLRLLSLTEQGWAGQQDIVACVRTDVRADA